MTVFVNYLNLSRLEPAAIGREVWYILDKSPVHHQSTLQLKKQHNLFRGSSKKKKKQLAVIEFCSFNMIMRRPQCT